MDARIAEHPILGKQEKVLPRSILTLILNDKDTGAPKAFMSANILSAYRTGAVPGGLALNILRKTMRK